jgi:hypothetical protein
MIKRESLALVFLLTLLPLGTAATSIDISGLKSETYSIGEDIDFKVLLLEEGAAIEETINVKITDALNKKEISKDLSSNVDQRIPIEDDFPSGIWTMTATYGESSIDRAFTIKENTEVEFILEGDTLIIRNKGNTRYTKTVQITIGDNVNSYAQNIGVGKEKRLKLISPEGTYNIKVSDGETSIERRDIELYGTGNVIGAVDEDLVGYTGFANVGDPENIENSSASRKKIPTTFIFIAAVFGLAILVTIERRLYKKKKGEVNAIVEIPKV